MPNKQDQKKDDANHPSQSNEKRKNSVAEDQSSTAVKPPSADTSETAKDTAKTVLNQAKDSASQAYGLAAQKATSKIEEQKSNLTSGLSGVADSIRQVGQNLREGEEKNSVTDLTAKYGETIADQIQKVSGYFENRDLKEIVRDVENFARRQPAIFIAASFATGLLAARFLKSSNDSIPQTRTNLTGRSLDSEKGESATNNQTAVSTS